MNTHKQTRNLTSVLTRKFLLIEQFDFVTNLSPRQCSEIANAISVDDFKQKSPVQLLQSVTKSVEVVDENTYYLDIRSIWGIPKETGFHYFIAQLSGHIDKDNITNITNVCGEVKVGKELWLIVFLFTLICLIMVTYIFTAPGQFLELGRLVGILCWLAALLLPINLWKKMLHDRQVLVRLIHKMSLGKSLAE